MARAVARIDRRSASAADHDSGNRRRTDVVAHQRSDRVSRNIHDGPGVRGTLIDRAGRESALRTSTARAKYARYQRRLPQRYDNVVARRRSEENTSELQSLTNLA